MPIYFVVDGLGRDHDFGFDISLPREFKGLVCQRRDQAPHDSTPLDERGHHRLTRSF